jgi:hypothetical protein
MSTLNKTLIRKSNMSIPCLALLSSLTAAGLLLVPVAAAQNGPESAHANHEHSGPAVPARLVEVVRNATRHFMDVNAATAANYQPLFGCVSGPDRGAMGVHYINLSLFGDGEINASQPEALIYEPWEGGLRLVGVEYIVDAATWTAHHNAPPMLEGQAFQFVNSPNRYGLPAFFELHVWAWRDNPNGAFVDWNTRVTCEGQ